MYTKIVFLYRNNVKRLVWLVLVCFFSISLMVELTKILAVSGSFNQTDWSGGIGQTSWVDTTKYEGSSNIVNTTSGQISLLPESGWCSNASCNTSWKYRKKITFSNGSQAENLVNFPVLVKLSSSNIDYSKTQNSGQDIRFTDTDGTELKYEIETWDEAGNSFVWVNVPQIDASSNTDYIYLYYGNSSASDNQTQSQTWNTNYKGVWHLNEDPSSVAPQVTNIVGGTAVGTAYGSMTNSNLINGKIGKALQFDGVDDYVSIASVPEYDFDNNFTIEFWWRPQSTWDSSDNVTNTSIISKSDIMSDDNDWSFFLFNYNDDDAGKLRFGTYGGNIKTTQDVWTANNWYHIALSYTDTNNATIYVNGVANNFGGDYAPGLINGTQPTYPITLGRGYDCASTCHLSYYATSIDELRIISGVKSSAWISASYKTQTDTFNTFGTEEAVYPNSGSLVSSIYDTGQQSAWGVLTYTTDILNRVEVKVRSSTDSLMVGTSGFGSCGVVAKDSDISANNCVSDGDRYIQYQIVLNSGDTTVSPILQDISIGYDLYDTTSPVLSSIGTTVSSTSTIINWNTNESSSSQIEYGLTGTYGTTTPVIDTSPGVLVHQVELSGLNTCTTYHYRVKSGDQNGNVSTSSDDSFTTTGCSGSASVDTQTATTVEASVGATISLTTSDVGISLVVPIGYGSSEANFQIKELDSTAVIASTSTPDTYTLIGSNLFDLKAMVTISTAQTTFDQPLLITMSYSDGDIGLVSESSLKIYRWSGTVWSQLSNCVVDSVNNKISCETSAFSVFGLFGVQTITPTSTITPTLSPTGTSLGSVAGGNVAKVCGDQSPGAKLPWLYGATVNNSTSVKIYFTEADGPVTGYALKYGIKSNEYWFGVSDMGTNNRGPMSYDVGMLIPGSTYYFRVRASNGCATGEWSNEIAIKVPSLWSLIGGRSMVGSEYDETKIDENKVEVVESTKKSQMTYVVKQGDTLSKIAKNELGSVDGVSKLIELNKVKYPSLTTNPSGIEVGWELILEDGEVKVSEDKKDVEKEATGMVLSVTVVDEKSKPVEGAKVTLHSNPREGKTNKSGVVVFKNVEPGQHRLLVDYNGKTGEDSLNVKSGEDTEYKLELTIKLKMSSPFSDPVVLSIIGVLLVTIGILLWKTRK